MARVEAPIGTAVPEPALRPSLRLWLGGKRAHLTHIVCDGSLGSSNRHRRARTETLYFGRCRLSSTVWVVAMGLSGIAILRPSPWYSPPLGAAHRTALASTF